jgi:very-short-patch-repair endonuclease
VTSAQRKQRRNETPDAAIRRLARRQHNLFKYEQAIEAGFSPAAISRRVSTDSWERVLRRVYRVADTSSDRRQAALAACYWAGDGAVASHRTAGVLWELDGVREDRVEITVPPPRSPRSPLVIVHRSLELPRADRVTLGVIPVTSPVRTLLDLAACLNEEDLEAAVEGAFDRGLVRDSVLRARSSGRRNPGVTALRRMLNERDLASPALESRLEVKVWRLLVGSGLPKPVRQHRVQIDGRRYRLDFAWPSFRVAVEADGFTIHGARRRAYQADRWRTATLVSGGWRIVPVTWHDATARPEEWLAGLGRTLALAA